MELTNLQGYLDGRLESIGLPSQPEVVLRLLDLSGNPNSQISDYAKVVKTDHAVSGRVLRLANSAFFAQRSPVTTIERACLVLGMERLKSVALGFHLSRAAMCGSNKDLTRDIWGQSVMRACLAAELARVTAPSHVAEAFVVGLMLDAGIPLMARLIGRGYDTLLADSPSPAKLYRLESETLPFTHVDVVASMARKWKLPELLSKPMEWHHVKPPEVRRDDGIGRLHRVAAVVGNMEFKIIEPGEEGEVGRPDLRNAKAVLGLSESDALTVATRSVAEYGAAIAVFADVASSLGAGETLADLVHSGLIAAVDSAVMASLEREEYAAHRLVVGGQTLQATREEDGWSVVVLYDASGQQLLSHRFPPGGASVSCVTDALGLDTLEAEDSLRLADYLKAKAA